MIAVIHSATGTVSQIPVILQYLESRNARGRTRNMPRSKEIIWAGMGLSVAVKKVAITTFSPINTVLVK